MDEFLNAQEDSTKLKAWQYFDNLDHAPLTFVMYMLLHSLMDDGTNLAQASGKALNMTSKAIREASEALREELTH